MRTERNRRDLREIAERFMQIIDQHSYESQWEKAMKDAQWEIAVGCFSAARKFINSARELRQFCRVMP